MEACPLMGGEFGTSRIVSDADQLRYFRYLQEIFGDFSTVSRAISAKAVRIALHPGCARNLRRLRHFF